jgi:glycosyltransferase involved in cell wall biosynthesis
VVLGAAGFALRHPATSARVLAQVVSRSRLSNLPPQLAAAAIGLAWAYRRLVDAPLHCQFGWVAATAAWAASTASGQPYSVVLHAFELHTISHLDGFTPVPLRAADHVFTISQADVVLVRERWAIEAEVLRMGVPRSWLVDKVTTHPDGLAVVSVGSLLPKKGHDVLLRALARTKEPWTCRIVGEGPERGALLAQIADLGIADRVSLAGSLPAAAVQAELSAADVFVLACVETPSGDRDGIPVALMEAMALGIPVVSTTVGGIPELVAGAGIVVEPGDPAAVTAALDLLADEHRRRSVAEACRRRIEDGWLAETGGHRVAELAR